MFGERFFNMHESRAEVVNLIAACTRKKTFRDHDGYTNYAMPLHNMLLKALIDSVSNDTKAEVFRRNISEPRKSMLYGTFTGSHGQRLLVSAIYRTPEVLAYDDRVTSAQENINMRERLKGMTALKFHVDPTDFAKDFQFDGFKSRGCPDNNPAYGDFNKKVVLTACVFYCDDATLLDEIGFFLPLEGSHA